MATTLASTRRAVSLEKKGRFGQTFWDQKHLVEWPGNTTAPLIRIKSSPRDLLVDEGVLLHVTVEGASANGHTIVKLALCDQHMYDKARSAMIVPLATRHRRLRCDADTVEALKSHARPSKSSPPPPPNTAPLPTTTTTSSHGESKLTLHSLEARLDKLRVDDTRRRLDELAGNAAKTKDVPRLDDLKARFLKLRDGDASGPVFNTYTLSDLSNTDAAEDDDALLEWIAHQPLHQDDMDTIVDPNSGDNMQQDERVDTTAIIAEARRLVSESHRLAAEERSTVNCPPDDTCQHAAAQVQEEGDRHKQPLRSTSLDTAPVMSDDDSEKEETTDDDAP